MLNSGTIKNWSLDRCNEELGAAGHYSLHNDVTEAREAVVAMAAEMGVGEEHGETQIKFEIQTHGTSGKWGYVSPCRVSWCQPEAKSLEEAVEVCRLIKRRGYGIRLIADGKVILSAPWQETVELGRVVEINNK